MLCREYSILPIEPVLESATKIIEVDLTNILGQGQGKGQGSPIEENFLQCNTTTYTKTLEYIDQPIKAPLSVKEASIVSFSLANVDNIETFKNTLRSVRKTIEIKDTPKFVTDYTSYKGTILSIISTLTNRTIINTDIYLTDIINDISSYNGKIQAIGTSIYGLCATQNTRLEDLFNYTVNTKILIEQIRNLKNNNIDLILDVDSICVPTEGVTNTYASQIWLFDFLCQISSIGLTNVFVNMDSYSNVYSILAYLYITRYKAVLNPYNYFKDSNINIYISENIKEYFVTVIHKDDSDNNVLIKVNAPFSRSGSLIRLMTNQTYQGTCGMTFGELTFDGSKDGYPIQVKTRRKDIRFAATKVDPENKAFNFLNPVTENGILTFVVPRMSITILKISKTQSGGAYFENINKSDEKNTVVTIRPNQLSDEYDSIPTTMTLKEFQEDYQPYM